MLELNAATYQAMLAKKIKTFYLYEIDYDSSETPLRWTSWDEAITYAGNEYTPFTVKHGSIQQGVDGKVSKTTLTVGNIDEARTIQTIIENYDILGNFLTIQQFFFDSDDQVIDDPVTVSFEIEGAVAELGTVTFTISIGFDYLLATIPARTMHRDICRWEQFKDSDCKYTGTDTTCEMNWDDCVSKNNTINFGGFPGILNKVFYF